MKTASQVYKEGNCARAAGKILHSTGRKSMSRYDFGELSKFESENRTSNPSDFVPRNLLGEMIFKTKSAARP